MKRPPLFAEVGYLAMFLAVSAVASIFISSSCSLRAGAPVPPRPAFAPAVNVYADRLVSERFELVEDFRAIDPAVRRAFFKSVPRGTVATENQPFALSDIHDGLPRRFAFAGHGPNMWFVLYEIGGYAHHHVILIFLKDGDRWRQEVAAIGYLRKNRFSDLRSAIRKNQFDVVFDNLNL